MAIVAVWSSEASVTMSDASPADTVVSTGPIDLATPGYDRVIVSVEMTFHASAADYVDVILYGSLDGGTSVDTIPISNPQRIDAVVGATVRRSFIVDGVPWVRVAIDNESQQEIT